MNQKISVIGAGSWGTSISVHLAKKNHDILIWSYFKEEADMLNIQREHTTKLPGIKLPESIRCTTNLKEALEHSNIYIFVVPAQVIRITAKKMSEYIKENSIVVCCSKGIEDCTGALLSEVLKEELPNSKLVILSGPSHAEEVAKNVPTVVVSASKDLKSAKLVQDLFMTPTFRVYTNDDVVGVEIGAALKNVIALCAGISDGLGFGDNAKAALMTRGMAEITRLGMEMGAKTSTFSGLTGIGDLIVTCTSMHSRNRRAGILIGQGKTLEEAIEEVNMVVEGVTTTRAAKILSNKYHVSTPIIDSAYNILFEGKKPIDEVEKLMARDKKSEFGEL